MKNSDPGMQAKDAVRAQYGSVGDAYVNSASHAGGGDLPRMIEVVRDIEPTRMLDIATGGGHVVRALAPYVGCVVATDLTAEILHHARAAFSQWELHNVTTEIADAEALPFADGEFDLVTCRIAPHHFPDIPAFVREVHRVLVSGGSLLLVDSTVPEGEIGAFFNAFEKLRDPSHVRSLTVAEWTGELDRVGFELPIIEDFPKVHDFVDWTARSRTPESVVRQLEQMMLNAPEDVRSAFHVVEHDGEPGHLQSFRDTKTLFHARKG